MSASGFSQAGAVPCWEGLAVGLATASVVFVVGRIKKCQTAINLRISGQNNACS